MAHAWGHHKGITTNKKLLFQLPCYTSISIEKIVENKRLNNRGP